MIVMRCAQELDPAEIISEEKDLMAGLLVRNFRSEPWVPLEKYIGPLRAFTLFVVRDELKIHPPSQC